MHYTTEGSQAHSCRFTKEQSGTDCHHCTTMELRHGSRRYEDHAAFWARITHEILARVTILDVEVPEALAEFIEFFHAALLLQLQAR